MASTSETPDISPAVEMVDSSDFQEPEMVEQVGELSESEEFTEPDFSEENSRDFESQSGEMGNPVEETGYLEDSIDEVNSDQEIHNEIEPITKPDDEDFQSQQDLRSSQLDSQMSQPDTQPEQTNPQTDQLGSDGSTKDVLDEEQSNPETSPEIIHPSDEIGPDSLEPNSVYERNGYEYKTDELGRTKLVTGDLDLTEGKRSSLQTEVGHMGVEGDDGGHLIGTRFNGPTDAFNLVPQNSNLNRGEWKSMENSWADAVTEGRDVKVMIEPIYGDDSTRPDSFDVLSQVDGELTYSSFLNQPTIDTKGEYNG